MGKAGRIGLRSVTSLKQDQTIWDSSVPGFGARRQKSNLISYVLFYRTRQGRQRWHTIGRHGAPWTPDMARDEARRLLGLVTSGVDPASEKKKDRDVKTVSQLCDLYLADAQAGRLITRRGAPKKTSTLMTDRGRIERHIKPLLGRLAVTAVASEDIEAFIYDVSMGKTAARVKTGPHGVARVSGGVGAATRTVGLLGAIFTYALRRKMRIDNPVRGVVRPPDGSRDRRLSNDEYALFERGLSESARSGLWPGAIAAARVLALTGWRRGEVLNLKWEEVDFSQRTAVLAVTKTGRSLRPLSHTVCCLLSSLPRTGSYIFPATRGLGPLTGFPKMWSRIALSGGLSPQITPHVLRHSFASLAADLGYSELTIAALLGHKGTTVTSRYVHTADAVLLSCADAVAERTLTLMNGGASIISLLKTA